ncbi:SprT family zinc-dependent metalloprotease [Luteimonas sp. 3794]|uniref:M48 family metallopeptidase n=1 Tax=Luteimonas sp. 3794 TaxID=2817730 RepID=UPI0028625334|nr:SprT family zinc-dependent metalloprotease [Luteimonas sp. 3794]MDR6989909.1 putative metal-dependent hydrolase [Luteimonas sp. 3794]
MPSLSRLLSRPAKPASILRDSLHLTLEDGREIEVLRVRDPRARRMRLSVNERGARLTLPLRASLVSGDAFLQQHRAWLAAQIAAQGEALPLQRGVTSHLPLRGALHPLRWEAGRFSHVRVDEDSALTFVSPEHAGPAALQRALREFYQAQARADIGRWLPTYLPGLPRTPRRICLKVMSSQWGSLAPDGTLNLDLSLVLGAPSAFEYVLVHELCHLIHADHSRQFWREVETRCPAWRDARDYFRDSGRRLKADLHALLA